MDVLFVGDNRNRANWGCRATSIALNQLISDKHEITEVVSGKEVGPSSRSDILYGSVFPSSVYRRIERRRKYRVAELYLELEQHFGARTDFVEEDPQRSVSNFHRARQSHQHLKEIYRKVKNCDAVVINGEGDLILTTPPRRKALFYLFLIELSLELDKKVYYVNAMFSDCPVTGRNERTLQEASSCLQRCEAVVWRDPTSRALYEEATTEAGGTAWLPDALFAWHARVNEAVEELPDDGNMFLPFKREGGGLLRQV